MSIKKYSVTLFKHKTSITLEEEFWQLLKVIALQENKSITSILEEIDSSSLYENLSSKIRIYILEKVSKDEYKNAELE